MAPRAAPRPRVRAVHHPRDRARRSGSATGAGGPAADRPARSPTSRSGRCRSASSAAGSTTSSPRRRRTSARAATRSRPSRSGRAASASGAPSRSAPWAPGSAAGAAASRCRRWPTPSPRGSRSPRRSAAGATGSTTSCSAGRPSCPGGWRSPSTSGRRASTEFATFHPTFLYESLWCLGVAGVVVWADRRFRMGHGRVFALYVAAVRGRPGLVGVAAHRRGQRDPRPAGELLDVAGRRPRGAGLPGDLGAGPPRPRGGRRAEVPDPRQAGRRTSRRTGSLPRTAGPPWVRRPRPASSSGRPTAPPAHAEPDP